MSKRIIVLLIIGLCASVPPADLARADPPCDFNGTECEGMVLRRAGKRFSGAVGDPQGACMDSRPVLLKKKRDGVDRIKAYNSTDVDGEFGLDVRTHWHGVFYAVAPEWDVPQTSISCGSRTSNRVRLE